MTIAAYWQFQTRAVRPPRRGVLPTTTNDRKVTMLRAYRLVNHLGPGKRAIGIRWKSNLAVSR